MDRPDRCPDCDWPIPAVPPSLPDSLALAVLRDHAFYDCPAGPRLQTRPPAPHATVSP
jgi:hypothetical protein